MTTLLISQSNYIPWRGYFDLIAAADVFIILDDVQYTHQDWRNRNQIKTRNGPSWMTIPVRKERSGQRISETVVANPHWAEKHWRMLEPIYRPAACFKEAAELLRPLYLQAAGLSLLSDINRLFLDALCAFLDIRTTIHRSTDFFSLEAFDGFDKNQRNIRLCKEANASRYVSGPSAKNYMDMKLFDDSGIEVYFADYRRYPEYPQLHGSFAPNVSLVDVLFNTGKKARDYTVGFAL